ncbi:MAG: hypothetical protein LBU32_15425, partial [Clostridiales bacterium]|nr:hypothetical protein [Clostridiales bacterium]
PFANAVPRFCMLIAPSLPLRTVQPQAVESGAGANAPEYLYILGQRSFSMKLRLADQDLLPSP